MRHADRKVITVVEQSALLTLAERFARKVLAFWATSRLRTRTARVWAEVAPRSGTVLLSAVATHVVLTVTIARPASGYWLILPALFAVAGLTLVWAARGVPKPGD